MEPFVKYREFVPPRNGPCVVGLIIVVILSLVFAFVVGNMV